MRKLGAVLVLFSLAAACSDDVAPAANVNNTVVVNNSTNNTTNNSTNNATNNATNNGANNATTCSTSAECSDPEVCVIDLTTGTGTCGVANGGGTGESCSSGSDCASGICLNGLCADPCRTEADCPAGFQCDTSTIPLTGGGSVDLAVCVPEGEPCLSNEQCSGADVCVVDRSGNAVELSCGTPVGGGNLGDTCTADSQCKSNLCLDGTCTLPCERPVDCANDGSYICDAASVTTAGGSENVNVCQPRPADVCLSDAQCSGNDRCVASRTATDVEFGCGAPNQGGGETGAACMGDGDCAQNLCVNNVCAGPCQGNGDCAAAADYACELTSVDLGNNVSDNAQICVPPRDCERNSDCRTTEVCYVRTTANTVDTFCRAKNVGGGALGQVCSNTQECANNYCLDTRFRDVCAVPCASNADCNRSGYSCQATTVAGETINMCVPNAATTCTSNDDCPTNSDCAVIPNAAGSGLESVCVPTTGGDATGVTCTVDTDCASLVCLGNACAAPCDDSTQCANNQLCQAANITKGNVSGNFDVCTTLADIACDESSDCSDGVRVCSDIRVAAGNQYETYCEFPNTNATKMMGETCTTANDCRENVCLQPAAACSVVCNSDDDCAAGMGCSTYTLTAMSVQTAIGFCIDLCADNGDCSNGNLCTINGDTINDDVDQVCEKPVGTKDLGELCASGNECNTGLCLRTLSYGTTACSVNADCSMGETCACPIDNPSCAAADKRCATTEFACTRLCNDNTDCSTGSMGNELTECSPNTRVTRPNSMTSKTISTCARP